MATEEQSINPPSREGSFSRVVGALVSPRKTFASIVQSPSWLLPVLLIIIVNLVLVSSFSHRIGWATLMEKQMANNSTFNQMTPVQQQQMLDRLTRYAPIGAYAGSTVGVVIILLITSLIFLLAFNIVFGTNIKFRQSFAISAFAFMPGVVKNLLALLVVWVRPPEGVSLQNMVMSNVGAFLPATVPPWLLTLGGLLDVFTFWSLALLAVGYAAAGSSRKVRFGSALAVVVAIWLVFVLGLVGITALRG
jgi:hypothetical protein